MEMPPGPPLPGPANPPSTSASGAEPAPPVRPTPTPWAVGRRGGEPTPGRDRRRFGARGRGPHDRGLPGDPGRRRRCCRTGADPCRPGRPRSPSPRTRRSIRRSWTPWSPTSRPSSRRSGASSSASQLDIELLDGAAYIERSRADFEEDLAEDPDDLENAAAALGALGLWPDGVDPVDVLGEYFSVGSLGYYDPETGEMVVRGAADTPNLRTTLVHELTHALDDQHFELDRPELDDRPDEARLRLLGPRRGQRLRVEAAYTASLTDEERADAEAEQQGYIDGVDLAPSL